MYILWRRMYSTSSRLALAHSSRSSHPPLLSFPHAEHLLLIMMHEFSHFTLYVTQLFVPVVFMNNPAYPLCIFHSPLPFTRLQLLKVLFQLFFNCLSDLAHPRSYSLPLLGLFVLMRTRAFALQPYPNSSRVGDRPHTCVDKPWSSLVTRANPNMHRSATAVLFPGMAMIYITHPILEFTSDVSSCTK